MTKCKSFICLKIISFSHTSQLIYVFEEHVKVGPSVPINSLANCQAGLKEVSFDVN